MLSGGPPPAPAGGLADLRVIEAIEEAQRTGKAVKVRR
jgi:hypothetical protein